MAQMKCACGVRLSNCIFPNEMEGKIQGLYEFNGRTVWHCIECGRLYIDFDDPEVKGCRVSKSYVPEDGAEPDLFRVGTEKECIDYLKIVWSLHKDFFKKIESGFFDD